MKTRLALALCLFASTAFAQTSVPISGLPYGGLMQQSDTVPMVRGGTTMRAQPYIWPSNGQVMISTGTSAPQGLAPINGYCLVGNNGVWAVLSCTNALAGNGLTLTGSTLSINPLTATAALNLFTGSLQGVVPASGGGTTNFLRADGTWSSPAAGTVTITGSPSSGNLTKFSGPSSVTNGDLTGDVTTSGGVATTLATVNSNVGTFGSSTAIPSITFNGKGLATAVSTNVVIAPAGTLSGTTLSSGVTSSSLTTLGTIATGVWQGTPVGATYGGTGVNNGSNTLTLGGNVTYSGAHTVTWTTTGNTALTLPTSGTLLTGNQTITLSGDVTGSGTTSISTTVADIAGVAVGTPTGTGNVVFSNSPTLVTPALGTPSAAVLTHATGLPLSTGVTGILPSANGGAGSITGALKGNGSGTVSQAACADLSNGATGCSTATGTSGATIPLNNGSNTLSGNNTSTGSHYFNGTSVWTAVFSNGNSGTSLALNIDNGPLQSTTITGAVTITLTTPTHSGRTTIIITQDGSGHVYSITGCKWPGGVAITYSTAASAIDVVSIAYDGSHFYCMGGSAFSWNSPANDNLYSANWLMPYDRKTAA